MLILPKIWLDKEYFFSENALDYMKRNCYEEIMSRIMYSKPNATFEMGENAKVAVSFSVNSPKSGEIVIFLH